ncbi:MAG: tetratricopeptide repeat-containing protein, partial [Pseudomonadota bacterium]
MTTAENLVAGVDALLRASEYLKAFDAARKALRDFPEDRRLKHRAVLSLARIGASVRARAAFNDFGLDAVDDDEDIVALWARLLKDAAFELPEDERKAALSNAAAAYEKAHEAGSGYYSAINVASLHFLAG